MFHLLTQPSGFLRVTDVLQKHGFARHSAKPNRNRQTCQHGRRDILFVSTLLSTNFLALMRKCRKALNHSGASDGQLKFIASKKLNLARSLFLKFEHLSIKNNFFLFFFLAHFKKIDLSVHANH